MAALDLSDRVELNSYKKEGFAGKNSKYLLSV